MFVGGERNYVENKNAEDLTKKGRVSVSLGGVKKEEEDDPPNTP